jgi:hypothetical protein
MSARNNLMQQNIRSNPLVFSKARPLIYEIFYTHFAGGMR